VGWRRARLVTQRRCFVAGFGTDVLPIQLPPKAANVPAYDFWNDPVIRVRGWCRFPLSQVLDGKPRLDGGAAPPDSHHQ
jgi:hypothetical protein